MLLTHPEGRWQLCFTAPQLLFGMASTLRASLCPDGWSADPYPVASRLGTGCCKKCIAAFITFSGTML